MTAQKDYYQILGVNEKASADEIKRAYRKLAFQFHPDRNPTRKKESEERFKEISEAYYVLNDPKRREEYDLFRRGGFGRQEFRGASGFNFEDLLNRLRSGRARGSGSSQSSDWDDLFGDVFSFTSGPGGRSNSRGDRVVYYASSPGFGEEEPFKTETKVNTDLHMTARVSKEKVLKGHRVLIKTKDGQSIAVTVPKHVQNGQTIRVRGQGKVCPCCDKKGDLFLKIQWI